jgi:uncharacterized protein YbjT (DUF2867 family)
MMKLTLVTGATGNIGFQIVKQLGRTGATFRAAVHSLGKAEELGRLGVEVVRVDYEKPETIDSALRDVDELFMLTPFVPNMVDLSSKLLDRLKKSGVKHIVRQSALNADVQSDAKPLKWHGQVEDMIKKSGIPYTILRPNFFMQNFVNFMSQTIREQNTIYQPAGDGKASFIDASDIAAVAVAGLTEEQHQSKIYTLTGPEALSYHDAARIISNNLGRKISYVPISEEDARRSMKQMQIPSIMIDAMIDLGRIIREGRASIVTSTVEDVTGKKPVAFHEFVKANIKAFA